MNQNERREERRIRPSGQVKTIAADRPAHLINISTKGAGLEIDSSLRPNSKLSIAIPFEDGRLTFIARVCRCQAKILGRPNCQRQTLIYVAGLKFSALSEDQSGELEQLLTALNSHGFPATHMI